MEGASTIDAVGAGSVEAIPLVVDAVPTGSNCGVVSVTGSVSLAGTAGAASSFFAGASLSFLLRNGRLPKTDPLLDFVVGSIVLGVVSSESLVASTGTGTTNNQSILILD